MQSKPREKPLVLRVLAELERVPRLWVRKHHGTRFTRSGHPDLYGCYLGKFFAFEAKREGTPDGKGTTKLQDKNLRDILAAGGFARVVRSVDEALEVLEEIRRSVNGGRES